MQNIAFYLLFIFLVCSASVYGQTPPPPAVRTATENWREYAFPKAGFALQMPEEPSPGIRGTRLLGGQKRAVTFHNCLGQGFTIYTVRYADLPAEATDVQAIKHLFDEIQNEKLTERNANSYAITSQREISLNGHSGRWVQHELKNKTFLQLKMFVVQQRLFLLEVLFTNDAPPGSAKGESKAEQAARKFMDSFRLLEIKDKE